MPDDQVTISTKSFAFHYVTKTTGEIDGLSFLTQTEDALNDIGQLAQSAYNQSTVAESKIQQALDLATNANTSASTALTTANKASSDVATLTITVTSVSQQAQNAVTVSQNAQQNASQALSQSQQAVTTANEAKTIAQEAVTDTSAAEQRVNQAAQTAQENAQAAQNSAQGASNAQSQAQTAATAAQDSVELAQKWASWMGDGSGSDETVDGTDYSAKWWAQHAEDIGNDVVHISAQTLTSEQKGQVWANIGLQNASTSTGGVILITTQEKIATGTDNASAVTPLSLNSNAVLYSKAQMLTDEQKQQARDNIGATSADDAMAAAILQAFQDFADKHGITVPETTNTEGE